MHVINGGNYNGKEYSCMFDARAKYRDLSPNECYYFQCGIEDTESQNDFERSDKSTLECNDKTTFVDIPAILVFSVETDNLIYAERMNSYEDYEFVKEQLIENKGILKSTLCKKPKLHESSIKITEDMMDMPKEVLPLTSSELLELQFGTKVKVIWHNSKHHPKNETFEGIIFGDKIGYTDGLVDETRNIAECVYNDWCQVFIQS